MWLTLWVVLAVCMEMTFAHVSLTFPPARRYALDFLDTFRTDRPCGGMPKGDTKTTLPNGGDIDIEWHLGYPHLGTSTLYLLDSDGNQLRNLTPSVPDDELTMELQMYRVSLPSDLTCSDCIIRLERQALEWGENYRFRSCADVDIVSPNDFTNDCSGHGTLTSGDTCSCDTTYFGDRCQFKDDCETDAQCQNDGRCIDLGGTALPRRQCFCPAGFFGFNCEKESTIKNREYNASNYEEVAAGGVDFLWRFVDDDETEFEGIVICRTLSFVAVGWRPIGVDRDCYNFPSDVTPYKAVDFHPMDCTDIVVGTVRDDSFSRIEDYYTRDRSTPHPDAFYGGESSLTGALGWEEDGVTTIMFRKKVETDEKTDYKFKGELHFIWAHGRNDHPFYRDDELKYHSLSNRGSLVVVIGKLPLTDAELIMVAAIVVILVIMLLQALHNLCFTQK